MAAAIVAVVQTCRASSAAAAAEDAETRAIAAAEKSASAADRSATAADRLAEAQSTLAELAATKASKPPWKLAHRKGDTYEAVNDGPTAVFGVEVSGECVLRGPVSAPRVEGGSAVGFWGLNAMGVDETVTVSWHTSEDLSDSVRTWNRALPARPRR